MTPSRGARRWAMAMLLVASSMLVAAAAHAADEDGDAESEPAAEPSIPLPPMPELPPVDLSAPSAAASKSLRTRLDELTATRVSGPLDEPNLAFLEADLHPGMVRAVAQRLTELRETIDGDAAERLLGRARDAGQEAIEEHEGEDPEGDWLVFVLSLEEPESDTWRHLVRLYGMLRILEHLGTTPAVRQMIESYSYFGDLVRIDLQRALERLKDHAVPALLEAKKHDARRVRRWVRRQLDRLGRAIPGEAVSTTDPQILADVLRAFGRIRDVDATRVVLSFAGSDRAQLRRAARQAIGGIGEPAEWHLKDVYETRTGDKPPRDWDWKRAARELFRVHDQSRLAPVYASMNTGAEALEAERYAEAVEAFDAVLARSPLFDRRDEMPPAYLARAEELMEDGRDEEAMQLLRKGMRLLPSDADDTTFEAKLTFLEAKRLVEQGRPDRFLIKRAIELDPDNADAKALLAGLEEKAEQRQSQDRKYGAAVGVGAVALVILILLARVRRRPKRTADDAEPDAEEGAPEVTGASPSAGDEPEGDEAEAAQTAPIASSIEASDGATGATDAAGDAGVSEETPTAPMGPADDGPAEAVPPGSKPPGSEPPERA